MQPSKLELAAAVAQMRADGLTYAQIGRRFGFSKQKAHRLWQYHKQNGAQLAPVQRDTVQDIGTPTEVLERHGLNPAEWRAVRFKEWEAQRKGGAIQTLCSSEFRRVDPAAEAMQRIDWRPRPRVPFRSTPAKQYALVVPDAQIGYSRGRNETLTPYHDRRAIDVCIQAAQMLGDSLAFIVFCGDMLDCAESTRTFSRPASTQRTTWPAILEWRWIMERFRMAAPHAACYWLSGNHELRIQRVLTDAAPELSDLPPADDAKGPPLLSMERLCGLDSIDVNYLGPYGSKEGELFHPWGIRFHHGQKVGAKGGQSVSKNLADALCSNIFGHVHRLEVAYATRPDERGQRRDIFAATFGCVCHTDGRVPSNKPHHDWQQGLGILTRCADGWVEPTAVRIRPGGRAVIFGEELTGSDYVADLRADTSYPY